MTSVSEYLCAKTKYMVRLMCLKEMQVDALTSLVLNLKNSRIGKTAQEGMPQNGIIE